MKPAQLIVISAFAFSLIGLGAAWGIGSLPPLPGRDRDFEQTMFIVLPLCGGFIGWFAAYLATPLRNEKQA